jgi:hypothetical protein
VSGRYISWPRERMACGCLPCFITSTRRIVQSILMRSDADRLANPNHPVPWRRNASINLLPQ